MSDLGGEVPDELQRLDLRSTAAPADIRRMKRSAFGVATVLALALAGLAAAANPSKEKVALTAAGTAQAKAEVLRQADIGAGWSGGAKKPQISSTMPCSYRPKQSDLVVIGAAETDWHNQGLTLDSAAQVLKSPSMVQRDWQRTVVAPQVLPCLREGFAKALGSKAKLVSFGRVAFPTLARYTRAFRGVAAVNTPTGSVRVVVDLILLGAWRNELTLSLTGPATGKASMHSAEVRLALVLAGRLRP
jgi:hypothetical protein